MEIVCLGLNHRTAPVAIRERFALGGAALATALRDLVGRAGIGEAAIISTCNRVEIYAAAKRADEACECLMAALWRWAGESESAPPADLFYRHRFPGCVRHLLAVASGLDSMVLGETEILGQVKQAYREAHAAGATGPYLNRLFQRAFHGAKEVRSRTAITRGPTSVGAVAVELAEKIFGRLDACRAMILGAGETGELTARALLGRGVRSIFVANRSFDRAQELARATGGEALRFDGWEGRLAEVDIVIGSTAAPHAILTRAKLEPVMATRRDRPLFCIDLAVPRDIEPAVNGLDGVYLYDIDSLAAVVAQSMEVRRREIAACEQIIADHVAAFSAWLAAATARADRSGTATAAGDSNRVTAT